MTVPPQAGGGEIRRFVGLILIVIGALWMSASGLCSAAFAISLFADGGGNLAEGFSVVLLIAVYGGISALFGLGVYAIGRAMRPKT